MIDELVKAANAMGNAGISAKDWHGKLKTSSFGLDRSDGEFPVTH